MSDLTLEQFTASQRIVTWGADQCEDNGIDANEATMLMYADGCYIQVKSPGRYYLIIGCYEWESNDLKSLISLLYHRWYNES